MHQCGRVLGIACALAVLAGSPAGARPHADGQQVRVTLPQEPQQADPPAQFASTTEVFQIQVGLTDDEGNPLAGLGVGDLELIVNGQARPILDLRQVDAGNLVADTEAVDSPGRSTPEERLDSTLLEAAAGSAIPSAARRRFLIFVDLGFMGRRGLGYARGAATNFLDEVARDGDLIGLATYSAWRGLQQHVPFTSDRAQIRREIEALGIGRAAEAIDNGRVDLGDLALALGALDGATDGRSALAVAEDLEFTARQMDAGNVIRALETMAETLAPLQGRKHILYFSASIPDALLFSPRNGDGGNLRDMMTAVESARRSDVVIHTFLPEVMRVADMHDVSNMQSTFRAGSQIRMGGDRGFLNFVAAETGGESFFFRHQLRGGLKEVEEKTRSYYVLAFPVLDTDGETVAIQVRPRTPGVTVAWAPQRLTLPSGQEHSIASRQLQIADALEVGNDVRGMAIDILGIRLPGQDGYGRVAIAGEIPAQQLAALLDERDDDRLELEILGAALTPRGEVADYFRTRVNLDNVAAKLAQTTAPLRYQNVLAVPPGTYFVKILVRETQLSRLASRSLRFEIPATEPSRLSVETPLMVLPGRDGSFIRGVNPLAPPPHRAALPLAYPFVIGVQAYVPAIHATAQAGTTTDFLVTVRNATRHPFSQQPTLSVQAWLEGAGGGRAPLQGIEVLSTTPVPGTDATRILLRMAMPRSVPSGGYSLIVQVADHVAGKAVASYTLITVLDSAAGTP